MNSKHSSQASGLELRRVETRADWEAFIELPWSIYQGDPNWVPPLRIAVRDLLDVKKNPFFKHAYMHPVIACRKGKVVGRVVGIIDDRHNQFHREETAFFGFFECINDPSVANALMSEIARWAASRGMRILRGPMNPSTNHECGLLVEGFQDPPAVMMTYNPQYYSTLLEDWGLSKSKDLLAYEIDRNTRFAERLLGHSEKLKERGSVTFRPVDLKNFDREIDTILEIYNDAWEKNWGFVPMDEEEFRHMAKDMKLILDPRLLLIAEVRGEPAGFALTLPDINQVLKRIPNGKLLPSGLFKILWFLKGPGRKKVLTRCRILTLGIKRAYREHGIGPLFYTEYLKRGVELGYTRGEASWILEDNRPMNRAIEMMGGERTKVYRIYERALS